MESFNLHDKSQRNCYKNKITFFCPKTNKDIFVQVLNSIFMEMNYFVFSNQLSLKKDKSKVKVCMQFCTPVQKKEHLDIRFIVGKNLWVGSKKIIKCQNVAVNLLQYNVKLLNKVESNFTRIIILLKFLVIKIKIINKF